MSMIQGDPNWVPVVSCYVSSLYLRGYHCLCTNLQHSQPMYFLYKTRLSGCGVSGLRLCHHLKSIRATYFMYVRRCRTKYKKKHNPPFRTPFFEIVWCIIVPYNRDIATFKRTDHLISSGELWVFWVKYLFFVQIN